jgi:hypothetical protein
MASDPDPRSDLAALLKADPAAPVSGHISPPAPTGAIASSPEHDWSAAAAIVMPLLRPAGTLGTPLAAVDAAWLEIEATRAHHQVVLDVGPGGLPVVYALPAQGFDVIVNGDHLLAWRIEGPALREAALANLAVWSASAPWTEDMSGERRVLSSESGDGWDASRILLPEVRAQLAAELGPGGRVLIGLPEREVLVGGTLRGDDPDFLGLFHAFVRESADGAPEPIDLGVFELAGGELIPLDDDGRPRPAADPGV